MWKSEYVDIYQLPTNAVHIQQYISLAQHHTGHHVCLLHGRKFTQMILI